METQIQSHNFNIKQRELFSKLLFQAKTRAEQELESDYAADQRVEDEMLPMLAEEYGASELIGKIKNLHKQLKESTSALEKLGFRCGEGGHLSLHYDAPKALSEALEKAKRSARKERDKGLKKFDLAILAVLASEDVQEAKKIVEELL